MSDRVTRGAEELRPPATRTRDRAFEIRTRDRLIAPEVVVGYGSVPTATIGHRFDGRVMDGGIRSLVPDGRAVGPALTIRTRGRDSTACHKAIELIEPGDVVVIDRAGEERYACWGEMMTLAAKLRLAAGVVIDGPATDLAALRALGLPVFARGTSPVTTLLLGQGGAINVAVRCGGVEVLPGELVVADDDGVIVLAAGEAASLLGAVLDEDREDLAYRGALLAGRLPSELAPIDRLIEEANRG